MELMSNYSAHNLVAKCAWAIDVSEMPARAAHRCPEGKFLLSAGTQVWVWDLSAGRFAIILNPNLRRPNPCLTLPKPCECLKKKLDLKSKKTYKHNCHA